MAGYLVSDEDLKRLAAVLSDYERGLLNTKTLPQEFAGQLPIVHVVRVSGSPTSGTYPGYLQEYNETTATWTDLGSILIREINGAALTTNTKYIGRYAGDVATGSVYLVIAGGSSCETLTIDFVTSLSCVDGVITPVYSTVCIPCAYICTTTTTTTTAAPTSSTTTSSTSSTSTSTTTSSTSTTSSTTSTSSSTTSTTSTSCDAAPYGYAFWMWMGDFWSLYGNFCNPMAIPSYPTFNGTTEGETTSTCCTPM